LIKPENLFHGSKILKKRYNNKPIMIIENGIGNFDKKINGIVNDDFRINFLNEHIKMVQKALNEGINFIGYSL
jgi:6-phospho-beta-glucosidase